MSLCFQRSFSSQAVVLGRTSWSVVKPVHHKVKIDKSILSTRFPELKYPKRDPRSPHFKPTNVAPDRLRQHYTNTLKLDMLLISYRYGEPERIIGEKKRNWDGTLEYHLNRTLRKPRGYVKEQPDILKVTNKNIPELKAVHINCFVPQAVNQPQHGISAYLMLQQITGEKPKVVYSKSDVVQWNIRKGKRVGASIELKGKPMNDFVLTLTELVLPRIPDFKGLNSKGDSYGNISFGLTSQDSRYFPEISSFTDLWPNTYGMHITFVTSAKKDSQAKTLVSSFGVPFYGAERRS